jgi:hypothetical protein
MATGREQPLGLAASASRRARLARAVAAVRATDPARVESALTDLGGRRRWLTPLVFAAGAVALVFDGVVLLLQNWRLTLLQVLPAVWIWVMTWNLKTNFVTKPAVSTSFAVLAAVAVVIAAQVAYWCNATFAYTMVQERTDTRAAFREARERWRLIGGLALLTGAIQGAVWLMMPRLNTHWLWLALLILFVVQIYLFIAIPCWLIGVRKTGSRRERAAQSLTTGALSGVAAIPGFLLNRIGWLLLGSGVLGIAGGILVAIGAVFHVTASSSVRVVKLSVRLRPDEHAPPAEQVKTLTSAAR